MSNHIVKRGGVVIVLSIILCLLGSGIVNAFGVSAPYVENDTLLLYAGQYYNYTVGLQNGDIKNYTVVISWQSTDNIATPADSVFIVPSKNYDKTATFQIAVPSEAKIGKKYLLEFNVTPKVYEDGAIVSVMNIPRMINILVVEDPRGPVIKESDGKLKDIMFGTGKYALMILGIFVIIALAVFIVIRIWKISSKMSSSIVKEVPASQTIKDTKEDNCTISEVKNSTQLKNILKRMSDEEFDVPEIKEIIKKKAEEVLKDKSIFEEDMSRKTFIKKL